MQSLMKPPDPEYKGPGRANPPLRCSAAAQALVWKTNPPYPPCQGGIKKQPLDEGGKEKKVPPTGGSNKKTPLTRGVGGVVFVF